MARPDTEKAVVAFDVDDVFYPLNEHVANIARVDYNSIVTFTAKDNPILSHAERDRLYDAYQTPRLPTKIAGRSF